MNVTEYLKRKKAYYESRKPREFCSQCLRSKITCYCALLRPFDPKIKFVLLIHWREAQKKIATGRLTHQILENSLLLAGYNYSDDERVNQILRNPKHHCLVLYPGADSSNLTSMTRVERKNLCTPGKELVVFVVDGTWVTARKTVKRSSNLRSLPRITFSTSKRSNFRVRRQPKAEFFSTLEAVHEVIELLAPTRGFAIESRRHDHLLQVFDAVIDQQIALSRRENRLYTAESRCKKSAKAATVQASLISPDLIIDLKSD